MFSRRKVSSMFVGALLILSAFQSHALINPLNKTSLQKVIMSENPAELSVFILRASTTPDQVDSVIQSLNKTFKDPMFSSGCEATVQVVANSYVPHSLANDSKAYGVVRVQVTHTCPSAANKALAAFEASPYIEAQPSNGIHPAVTISN